jgi:type IV secretory pathway TrbF-like protein
MEWRQNDVDALRAKIDELTAECYQRAEEYGELMNTKNVWRFVAFAAILLVLLVMFIPKVH